MSVVGHGTPRSGSGFSAGLTILLRRLSLDLTGLLPKYKETVTFVRRALSKSLEVVEDNLKRLQHSDRTGRHIGWMSLDTRIP
ncbi:MAG: DUF1549 domain-containing protein [Planctomyces sp.]|nr:DUF1549 domain-containing protein [Planctomyces sp.]